METRKNISLAFFALLKEAITALLNNSLSQTQESFLIHSAHALSSNIIRIKFSTSPAIRHFIGLNEKDLGYDCIAELFERDDNNQLIHFKTYFSNFDCALLSDKELLSHFNRLITSSVNQNLMHVYRNFDPSLGKIIRNIKLAIAAHKAFQEIDRFDETCIAPIHCTLNEHLATTDLEFLYSMLQPHIQGDEFIPELLSVFSRCIREQEQYSRIVPLISIALTFRSLLVLKQQPVANHTPESNFEITEIIEKCISQIQKTIQLKKSDNECFTELYFKTIHNVFLTKLHHTNGTADSLYEGLKLELATIDPKIYQSNHRTKIEYYYRLCREEIASELMERKMKQ